MNRIDKLYGELETLNPPIDLRKLREANPPYSTLKEIVRSWKAWRKRQDCNHQWEVSAIKYHWFCYRCEEYAVMKEGICTCGNLRGDKGIHNKIVVPMNALESIAYERTLAELEARSIKSE